MAFTDSHTLETWLRHIRVLAEDIGPRGSTTDAERQARSRYPKANSQQDPSRTQEKPSTDPIPQLEDD